MNRILQIILSIAQMNSKKYPSLNIFLDWKKIEKYLLKNICADYKDRPLNILEALLLSSQNYHSIYDCNTNLLSLDLSLKNLLPIMSECDKKEVGNKLSNLGNTSFWDTATELWFLSKIKNKTENIIFDYPLDIKRKGFTSPNADISLINHLEEPVWLMDCTTPTLESEKCKDLKLEEYSFIEEPEKAINCLVEIIKDKFEKKFSKYVDKFPYTKFAIIVSLTKADDISAHFSTLSLLRKIPVKLDPVKFEFHPRLNYALVGRFQKNHNDEIEFIALANHFVV